MALSVADYVLECFALSPFGSLPHTNVVLENVVEPPCEKLRNEKRCKSDLEQICAPAYRFDASYCRTVMYCMSISIIEHFHSYVGGTHASSVCPLHLISR